MEVKGKAPGVVGRLLYDVEDVISVDLSSSGKISRTPFIHCLARRSIDENWGSAAGFREQELRFSEEGVDVDLGVGACRDFGSGDEVALSNLLRNSAHTGLGRTLPVPIGLDVPASAHVDGIRDLG